MAKKKEQDTGGKMPLRDKLLKNTTVEYTDMIVDSKVYQRSDMITTAAPGINIALSGMVDGGMASGILQITGESKHFKSGFALLMGKSYLDKYPDGIILFYDSEFGTTLDYFGSYGIDTSKVVHTPIVDIEQLKADLTQQLDGLERGDHVMIIIDSIGNLASRKEVDDALKGDAKADLTRPKQLKSLGRIITPRLVLKDVPLVAINHVYKEMSLYPKTIVGGGSGMYLSSDNIWIIGRQQEKDNDDNLSGYNFVINVEKSRYVKEKSKIPISVSFESGINRWSGLFDIAFDGGFIAQVKKGAYAVVDPETGEIAEETYSRVELENKSDLWEKLIIDQRFKDYVRNAFATHKEGSSILQ